MDQIKTIVYKNVYDLYDSIVPSDDSYHKTHRKRLGRTISVLLDEQPTEGTLLEVGTGAVVPLILKELTPKLKVHVTQLLGSTAGLVLLTELTLKKPLCPSRMRLLITFSVARFWSTWSKTQCLCSPSLIVF